MAVNRTYLIGLGAVVALALVWFLALRPHPSAGGSANPASHAAPTLPGATGLAKAVAKAHATVAASEQTGGKSGAGATAASPAVATPGHPAGSAPPASATSATGTTAGAGAKAAAGAQAPAAVDRAARVERDLVAGKIVLIYIWNPRASDEQAVHRQLQTLNLRHGQVSLYYATPGQVASFGAITTGVSVAETPTLLIINPHGVASTISGFTDNGSIEQAIDDAKRTGGAGAVQTRTLTALTTGSSRSAYLKRANDFCRIPLKDATAALGLGGTLQHQLSSVQGALAFVTAFITHLRALPTPVADRAHLTWLFAAYDRGYRSLGGALAAGAGGKAELARSRLLRFQVLYDESTQGLADYGMTSCFPQQAR